MARTLFGSAATKSAIEKGRNRRTRSTPTFWPALSAHSTYSVAVSPPEPMTTMTRSASGWPA